MWRKTVSSEDRGIRLDRFWGRELAGEGVSRERAKGWIKAGLCTVDGRAVRKPNFVLEGGEELVLEGEASLERIRAEEGEVRVVHEDSSLVVIDKQSGVSAHPAPGVEGPTVAARMAARFPGIRDMDSRRPGIVHRLDKETTGLMVLALDEKSRLELARQFEARTTAKVYLAVVFGVPDPSSGTIDLPMGRDPGRKTRMAVVDKGGREARSLYEVLWAAPDRGASLVRVSILTGRTHQIRVHMKAIGHPLLGDETYASRKCSEFRRRGDPVSGLAGRVMLHAAGLALDHPETGERLRFFLPPPRDFRDLLIALNRTPYRVGVTGSPGSGKSTLCRGLVLEGVPVFDADRAVAELYAPGGDGAVMLAGRFGPNLLREDGGVDKPALFRRMAEEDMVRKEVLNMVHPMVEHRWLEFVAAHGDEGIVAAEVPLLLEGDWPGRGMVDAVCGVFCPEAKRVALLLGRGMDPEMAAVLDSWQWPQADKIRGCGLAVANDGDEKDLLARSLDLVSVLQWLDGRREERFQGMLDALLRKLEADWPSA